MSEFNNGEWQLVTSESDFGALRSDWERLYRKNRLHSPFLAWGWVRAWIECLAGPHELRIVLWRDEQGSAQFIFPLIESKTSGIFGQRHVMLACGYGREASDYLGCLRDPQYESRIAALMVFGISRFIDPGTRVSLTSLDGRKEFTTGLQDAIKGSGRLTRCVTQDVCVATELPETWEDYLQSLSGNFRSQVRRRYRKTENEKSLRFRTVDADDAKEFTSTLVRLNRDRMIHKGKQSSLEDSGIREFLMVAVPYMAENNFAWMDVLEQDGETIGAALNFVHGETVFFYMGGIDQAAQNLGPGTALFAHVIKRGIDQNYRKYDFLRGQDSYKYRWGGVDVPMYNLDIYASGVLLGGVSRAMDNAQSSLKQIVRRRAAEK